MRVLGVDFGGSHIGLATGESEFGIVSAKPNLKASGTLAVDAKTLVGIATQEYVDAIVIGLALDSGEETKMSRVCRMLGDEIAKLDRKVEYVDESLTSSESEQAMRDSGLKASERRRKVDGEAACRILERFFDQEK